MGIIDLTVNSARIAAALRILEEITEELRGIEDETWWAGSALDYAIFVEKGTGPAENSGDGNAVERIREWASDKAIPAGAAIHSILSEKGTKPHPYRKPAVKKVRSRFEEMVEDVQFDNESNPSITTIKVKPESFLTLFGSAEPPVKKMAQFAVKQMKNQFGKGRGPQSNRGSLKASITQASTFDELVSKSLQEGNVP
jgi:hypothetical protein